MHKQIRVKPTLSPPDIVPVLEIIASAGINLTAIGGSHLELPGGELALSARHRHPDDAEGDTADDLSQIETLLEGAGYKPEPVTVESAWIDDRPGALYEYIASISNANLAKSRVIKDFAVGGARDGKVPVQVYFVEVKTQLNRATDDKAEASSA